MRERGSGARGGAASPGGRRHLSPALHLSFLTAPGQPQSPVCAVGGFCPSGSFQKPDKPNKGPVLMETSGPRPPSPDAPPLTQWGRL